MGYWRIFDVVGFVHVDLVGMNSFVVVNGLWANKASTYVAVQREEL